MNPQASPVDSTASAPAERAPLSAFLPPPGAPVDGDDLFDRFLAWVAAQQLELYPAQEEALLELWAGRHVVLATPTGSGKSLVALGAQFKAAAEGRRSFYTTPIKALASEKFFALCALFGAERVGMLTGDASINPGAPVVCCTAEVLSNMALRQAAVDAPVVIMDEFHYYADAERGVAWQVPLLMLPSTQFLLMSATLGNTAFIEEDLVRRTGREARKVTSEQRPVPLEFEYRETPLHETLQELHDTRRVPAYVVNFTQRECAELAQGLTSMQLTTRPERERIREAIGGFRFDTPYGKDMRRFLGFGVGVHHAGLLPKYRLLVEQLAQQGLLPVICGTDTLGVGVNIPIRTVVFNKLAKYDGRRTAILSVRDFKQIAGRAGRKGFDDQGWVVAQAPEHVIEVRRQQGKNRKVGKAPPKGEVQWSSETFDRLVRQPPEPLKSSFALTHGMVLDLLQRDAELDDPALTNFWSIRELIRRCHEDEASKRRLVGQAAELVRSLQRTGVVRLQRDTRSDYLWVVVDAELQREFSLHQTLSLFMLEALDRLDPADPDYVLDLLSVVESVLEDPEVVLRRQVDKLKDELVAAMKAAGVEYEERMERLEQVTHPKPAAELLYGVFDDFRRRHPWVRGSVLRPKSIGRDLLERYLSFGDYVRFYGLQRSEGVLLRYLSQLYRTLQHSVPERLHGEPVVEVIAFFRTILEHTDTSLLDEWESLLHPELRAQRADERQKARDALRAWELLHDPQAFTARVRAELRQLVGALARGEWEEAAAALRQGPEPWTPERLEGALAPLLADYGRLDFTPRARQAHLTRIVELEPRLWEVTQNLLDPEGEGSWHLRGTVDLRSGEAVEGPLVQLDAIAT